MPPWTWPEAVAGLMMRPESWTWTTFLTSTLHRGTSTSTSTKQAPRQKELRSVWAVPSALICWESVRE